MTRKRAIAIAVLAIIVAMCVLAIIAWRTHQEKSLLESEESIAGSMALLGEMELLFREKPEVDQDGDGIGEFGWLNELSGAMVLRRRDDGSLPRRASPVYIASNYLATYFPKQDVACAAVWDRSVVLFLPYPGKGGMDDRALDGRSGTIIVSGPKKGTHLKGKWSAPLDPAKHASFIDLQEKHFVAYAVPLRPGGAHGDPSCPELVPGYHSYDINPKPNRRPDSERIGRQPSPAQIRGRCAYVVNEKGEVHYTKMEHRGYLWPYWHVTDYRAAFVDDGSTDTVFNNPLADGQKGFDGNVWYKLKR